MTPPPLPGALGSPEEPGQHCAGPGFVTTSPMVGQDSALGTSKTPKKPCAFLSRNYLVIINDWKPELMIKMMTKNKLVTNNAIIND